MEHHCLTEPLKTGPRGGGASVTLAGGLQIPPVRSDRVADRSTCRRVTPAPKAVREPASLVPQKWVLEGYELIEF